MRGIMPATNPFGLVPFVLNLQRIALVFLVLGFFAMKLRLGKLNRYRLKTHDVIFTFAYLLILLSLPRMINFAYFSIISYSITPLIFIHTLLGIVVLTLGFVFVINKGSLRIKRVWKTKRNMQILAVLWIVNFTLGTYIIVIMLTTS